MTMPSLTVWPHCEVPPPRGVTIRPSSRQIASARSASSMVRGSHTPAAMIWVERRVGGVAAAVERIEQDLAGDLLRQPRFKRH